MKLTSERWKLTVLRKCLNKRTLITSIWTHNSICRKNALLISKMNLRWRQEKTTDSESKLPTWRLPCKTCTAQERETVHFKLNSIHSSPITRDSWSCWKSVLSTLIGMTVRLLSMLKTRQLKEWRLQCPRRALSQENRIRQQKVLETRRRRTMIGFLHRLCGLFSRLEINSMERCLRLAFHKSFMS